MVKDHSDSETRCRHIGYSYRLTARVILYAPSHRQDNTYHGLCYTSRGALAGTRNSSMGPPWRIDPTTHRTMSERSYHGATSRSGNCRMILSKEIASFITKHQLTLHNYPIKKQKITFFCGYAMRTKSYFTFIYLIKLHVKSSKPSNGSCSNKTSLYTTQLKGASLWRHKGYHWALPGDVLVALCTRVLVLCCFLEDQ